MLCTSWSTLTIVNALNLLKPLAPAGTPAPVGTHGVSRSDRHSMIACRQLASGVEIGWRRRMKADDEENGERR
eukprot:1295974-Rhodomonas_salina.2